MIFIFSERLRMQLNPNQILAAQVSTVFGRQETQNKEVVGPSLMALRGNMTRKQSRTMFQLIN